MNKSLSNSFGCLILIAAPILCISFAQTGKVGIWITLIAAIIGLIIGGLVGSTIGVATSGKASSGSALLAIIFALLFAFLANAGTSTFSRIWSSRPMVNAADPSVDALAWPLPTKSVDLELTYAEIENNYDRMLRSEWKSYKDEIVGQRIRWSGIIRTIDSDSFNLDLGQNTRTRRIHISELPSDIAAMLSENQKVEFEGRISEIREFLGLKIEITDVGSITTKQD